MSLLSDLQRKFLNQGVRVHPDVKVIASWDLKFSEASRIVSEGFPKTTFDMPVRENAELSMWQSFWLTWLQHERHAYLVIRPYENQALCQLLLISGGTP